MLMASLFRIAENWKQSKNRVTSDRMNQIWHIDAMKCDSVMERTSADKCHTVIERQQCYRSQARKPMWSHLCKISGKGESMDVRGEERLPEAEAGTTLTVNVYRRAL